jgi:membrane fusion protein (multidrug efflux system)
MVKWLLGLIGLLVVAGLALRLFGPEQAPQRPSFGAVPVTASRVQVRPMAEVFETSGTLEARHQTALKAEAAGRVVALGFQEGRSVSAGQVLFRLHADPVRARLQQAQASVAQARQMIDVRRVGESRLASQRTAAEANYRLAEAEFRRFEQLRTQDYVSAQELDERRARKDAAAANLAALEQEISQAQASTQEAALATQVNQAAVGLELTSLAETLLRAPFAGTVGERLVSLGERVEPGQTLATLVDLQGLKVRFAVPERFLGQLSQGAPVTLTLDAFAGQRFPAQVSFIDAVVAADSRLVTVKATLTGSHPRLRPGQFGRVRLQLRQTAQARVIPEEALLSQGEQLFVYKVTPKGTVQRQAVTLGLREPGFAEVVSGLSATDTVVTGGLQKLSDGATVTVR